MVTFKRLLEDWDGWLFLGLSIVLWSNDRVWVVCMVLSAVAFAEHRIIRQVVARRSPPAGAEQ